MTQTLRIATRSSRLALWQAQFVERRLLALYPGLPIELVPIVSTGDVVRDRPLHEVGGVGVFTKEIQDALLDGRADVAVHSLKDLPTQPSPGLTLVAVPERGPVHDVFLSVRYASVDDLPRGATVATSSLRRRSQLLRHRGDLAIVDIRGNVETRVRKLREEDLAGLILAAAGIERLGLTVEVVQPLPVSFMVPAVGQGALGIECRADDEPTLQLLRPLEHAPTRQAVDAERAFLKLLQGGCQVPIGAHAQVIGDSIQLRGIVLSRNGARWFEAERSASADSATALGRDLAQSLLDQGAGALLA